MPIVWYSSSKRKTTTCQEKKKRKTNVFQQIISSLFDAASDMWKERNRDRHRREHGNDISVETKIDWTIRNLSGKKNMVLRDDIDTYFGVNLDTRLNGSFQSKTNWIIRWEHSIHASIKRSKRNAMRDTDPIWKSMNLNKAPRFFVRRHRALKHSRDAARKKKKLRDSKIILTVGFEIRPVKWSTSKVPEAKKPPNYRYNMPIVRLFFRKKRNKEKRKLKKINDRYGDGWHK